MSEWPHLSWCSDASSRPGSRPCRIPVIAGRICRPRGTKWFSNSDNNAGLTFMAEYASKGNNPAL